MTAGCTSIDSDRPLRIRQAHVSIREIDSALDNSLQILLYAGRIQQDLNVANSALDGCIEIVGAPDSQEKILAAHMTSDEINSIRNSAVKMRLEKEKLQKFAQQESLKWESEFNHCYDDHRLVRKVKTFTFSILGLFMLLILLRKIF